MPAIYLVDQEVAGTECSSTYEGRHITLEESYLVHPYHAADALVDKGDPVLFGVGGYRPYGVGVAFKSAAAATDLIAIDTEGIWFLSVLGCVSNGDNGGRAQALSVGDPVYINKTTAQVNQLSGQDDPDNFVPFGYLLGDVAASESTATVVAVKVHAAPNFLDAINVGSLSLVNQVNVIDNWEMDTSAATRALTDVGETWGREYAYMKAYVGLSHLLVADEDAMGIYVRLEDDKASTGGDLMAIRCQTHASNAAGVWTRLYGQMIAVSNMASSAVTESFGLSVNMGGAGAAPAIQSVFQCMGDGTLGTLQSWFQTEIARGAGLEAETSALGTKTHQIPINIDGTIYCIPVVPWVP